MKALAAFYYNFDSKEIMLVFEDGLMTIADDVTWVTFDRHYVHPKNATELISYYRSTANWTEFEL